MSENLIRQSVEYSWKDKRWLAWICQISNAIAAPPCVLKIMPGLLGLPSCITCKAKGQAVLRSSNESGFHIDDGLLRLKHHLSWKSKEPVLWAALTHLHESGAELSQLMIESLTPQMKTTDSDFGDCHAKALFRITIHQAHLKVPGYLTHGQLPWIHMALQSAAAAWPIANVYPLQLMCSIAHSKEVLWSALSVGRRTISQRGLSPNRNITKITEFFPAWKNSPKQ